MDERDDFDLDAVFASVDGILKGSKDAEPIVDDSAEQLGKYSRIFIHAFFHIISRNTDPNDLASPLKIQFDKFKADQIKYLKLTGEARVADILGVLELGNVVMAVELYIGESEREIVDFKPGGFEYRRQEEQIRRLEIFQRAADRAKDL